MVSQTPIRSAVLIFVGLIWMSNSAPLSADDSSGSPSTTQPIVQAVTLDAAELTESSGLVFSRRTDDRVWTHNDSGGQAKIYAFDISGAQTGFAELANAGAIDWEDIVAVTDQGIARLIVADTGDNPPRRKSVNLYLFDEPDPDSDTTVQQVQKINVTYPDGPHDCEAVAADIGRRRILLATKTFGKSVIYQIPLPVRNVRDPSVQPIDVVAAAVARIAVPLVTGMDLDPATGDLWMVNYFRAYQFRRITRDQDLATLANRKPNRFQLPVWKQIEAIGLDHQGRAWITSEGSPARMGRLPLASAPDQLEP